MSDPVRAAPSRASTEGALAVELYASAVAITRYQLESLARFEAVSLRPLERVAHALASSSANPAFAIASVLATTARDDGARAVQSAMLAVAIARRRLESPRALRRLAYAALLVDTGRARLAGEASIDLKVFRELPDSLDALVPATSATLGIGSSPALASAALTAFEVAWLERPHLGPVHAGALAPRFASRLLFAVRAYLSLVAPSSDAGALSPLAALERLSSREDVDRAALGALIDALGLPPVGTVVELAGHEWAVVAPSSAEPGKVSVRLLTDAEGRPQDRGAMLLLDEPGGATAIRVVEPAEARFNLARPFYRG
jgi:hypothetical protein